MTTTKLPYVPWCKFGGETLNCLKVTYVVNTLYSFGIVYLKRHGHALILLQTQATHTIYDIKTCYE